MLKDYILRARRSAARIGQPRLRRDIFFLHVPKCGGSSITDAIRQHYLTMDPRDDHKIGHLHPHAALTTARTLGQPQIDFNRDILPYFLGQDYRYVFGHFAFNQAAYDAFKDKYAFVTLLRDPVKRWFSLYFYNRYKEGDHYALVDDLETFLESDEAVGYGSDYVMRFVGDGSFTDHTSQQAIDRAISNLNHFDLVGVMEDLPMFVKHFKSSFGVDLNIPHRRKNPLSPEKQRGAMTPETLARVQELNRPNIALYEHVINRLLSPPSSQ